MKVRLVAIAKDEGAYLLEWVYWHLNKGFDQIHIVINNNKDNSETILSNISKKYPVSMSVVSGNLDIGHHSYLIEKDFLAKNPLQSKIYVDLYIESEKLGYTHIMFLDIDEYLSIKEKSIHELIAKNKEEDVLLFNWFNVSGNDIPFSTLTSPVIGNTSCFTKFIMRTGLTEVCFISTHNLCLKSTTQHKRLVGRDRTCDNGIYIKNSGWSNEAYVIHRYLRSRIEYISLLSRGDTWNNSLIGLKNNRDGWFKKGRCKVELHNFFSDEYERLFKRFINDTENFRQYEIAKKFVMNRANETKVSVERIRKVNKDLDRVLFGTNLYHIDKDFKYRMKIWLNQFFNFKFRL